MVGILDNCRFFCVQKLILTSFLSRRSSILEQGKGFTNPTERAQVPGDVHCCHFLMSKSNTLFQPKLSFHPRDKKTLRKGTEPKIEEQKTSSSWGHVPRGPPSYEPKTKSTRPPRGWTEEARRNFGFWWRPSFEPRQHQEKKTNRNRIVVHVMPATPSHVATTSDYINTANGTG